MLPKPVHSNRPVKEKIAWADACFEESGLFFLKEKETVRLLSEFKTASKASRKKMDASGVVALCRECDQEEGGSCCGKGLEDRYDAWLLLINRLLGVEFPRERNQADGCLFLGEKGCLLTARHVICINYMCRKITGNIHPLVINDLREVEGTEINFLFMLNEQVKRTFKKWMEQQKRV